jgi:hypothetical protein
MKGNLIFSRTSWGKKEASSNIGVSPIKANSNAVEIAKLFWIDKSGMFEVLPLAMDDLINAIEGISPTISESTCRQLLKDKLAQWENEFNDDYEKGLFKQVIIEAENNFISVGTVGRNKLRQQVLTTLCNLVGG